MAAETARIDTIDPVDGQTVRPSPARVYDYLLGGKDHYGPDRQIAAALCALAPGLGTSARAGRRFMARVVRRLAAEHGVEQFLDIGAGLPARPDVHDVVGQVRPGARVVYVDNDPVVTAHARALMCEGARGEVRCAEGDVRRPRQVLASAPVQQALDSSRRVAVLLLAVLDAVPGDEAREVITELLEPWPAGSMVAVSAAGWEGAPAQAAALERFAAERGVPARFRSVAEIRALLAGLDVLAPGVVPVHRWHPDVADRRLRDHQVLLVGGVAVKR